APASYGSPKRYPGLFTNAGIRKYDQYNLTNTGSAPTCVGVAISGTCASLAFMAAYLGSYDPADFSANYLADPRASSPVSFSFMLGAAATAAVVVHEVNPGTQACTYQLAVSGLPIACAIADVRLQASAPPTATSNGSFSYTLKATNAGGASASNVVVSG